MRRLMVVLLAAVSASLLISFVAVAAGAQTETTDPSSSGDPTQQESTAPAPEDTTGDSQPYHQVVDNATAGSFDAPGWQVGPANESTYGQDFAYADPADQVGPARFTVDTPKPTTTRSSLGGPGASTLPPRPASTSTPVRARAPTRSTSRPTPGCGSWSGSTRCSRASARSRSPAPPRETVAWSPTP